MGLENRNLILDHYLPKINFSFHSGKKIVTLEMLIPFLRALCEIEKNLFDLDTLCLEGEAVEASLSISVHYN